MSTAKPPYDPVKTVEGMFNGSVTRIAYAMKDPLNYAQSTKAVLAETAKKFQDALDDCEIQILDAKWYLERQLALNRARREAKAKEDNAASAKRKLDELKDATDKAESAEKENAPKRVKTAEPDESAQSKTQPKQPPTAPVVAPNNTPKAPAKPLEKPAAPKPTEKPKTSTTADNKRKPSVSTDIKASQPKAPLTIKAQDKASNPASGPEPLVAQPVMMDDYPKATPHDTPAGGNEDFNFVSMFGEPSGTDMMDGSNDDMGFDMTIGNDFDIDPTATAAAQDSSLTSLLPGLESYANQTGDDNTFNLGGGAGAGTIDLNNNSTSTQPPQPAAVNDFGLPTLGPNEFDDFLNDNDMNFDAALDDGLTNMESMENMDFDFDSMFK